MKSVSNRKPRKQKSGYKKPPLRVAGTVTTKMINTAMIRLVKKTSPGWLERIMHEHPESFRSVMEYEFKLMASERAEAVANAEHRWELWKRWDRTLDDFERCAMHLDGLYRERGAYGRRCQHCRKAFVCMRPHGRYCSLACRSAARTKQLAEHRRQKRRRYCRQCHVKFVATRCDARFCSPACRLEHFRKPPPTLFGAK